MRLLDPQDDKGRFPFTYTPSTRTDVRATWDRLVPGWRERKPDRGQQAPVVNLSRRRK